MEMKIGLKPSNYSPILQNNWITKYLCVFITAVMMKKYRSVTWPFISSNFHGLPSAKFQLADINLTTTLPWLLTILNQYEWLLKLYTLTGMIIPAIPYLHAEVRHSGTQALYLWPKNY